ncbi:hypothetical protein [Nocardia sp. NPDC050175]|uniref:hypothetical protein n=1 Tax=Nocardia sp. NPDC050175 TaxID=3364317 RepID=UPI0037A72618
MPRLRSAIDIAVPGYLPFQPGPAGFTTVWDIYDANGDPPNAELVNATVTLQS